MIDVAIDSKKILPGQVFVALHGKHRDGHEFIAQAIEAGAAGLIIKKTELHRVHAIPLEKRKHVFVLPVPDPLSYLQELAMHWRMKFSYPVIGITGSVGKTTTKELLAHIVRQEGLSVCASRGNQNSTIGLPINMLRMRDTHDLAIFEMGISVKGEMDQMAKMARPTIGVITSICLAHSEGLGSLDEIAAEKKKIFSFFTGGEIAITPEQKVDVSITDVCTHAGKNGRLYTLAKLNLPYKSYSITLQSHHECILQAARIAATVAYRLGVSAKNIIQGIQTFQGVHNRFEYKALSNNRGIVISDCYNANPKSMTAAIRAVDELSWSGEKVAILGDMLELGKEERASHKQIGSLFKTAHSFTKVILVGARARNIAHNIPKTAACFFADDWKGAYAIFQNKFSGKNLLVLVKASNGMQLTRLVDSIV